MKDTIETGHMNDEQLLEWMKENGISLTIDEVRSIQEKLGRDPTITELHIFNIEWSEHCSYKSSKRFLKTLPTEASNVILGPSEDAGIIYFDTVAGERHGIVLRQESHNHPSHIVPYEGAATGIGGIVRDILCMGARVIGTSDPLRFGDPNDPKTKYIASTVIDGIAGYGNAIGIPNLAGDICFSDSYTDNCLVNVACLGIVKESEIIHSFAPKDSAGYDIVLVGKATDNSGFGGAAFASLVMDEEQANKGAVQVPDPFLKNVIIRATYRVFEEIRAKGIKAGFKDCGAGGIMCATSELGAGSNVGVTIDIDKIPVSMDIPPFVTACSETQERLVWMVPKEFTPVLLRIYNEEFELPNVAEGAAATTIGEVTAERDFIMRFDGEELCNAPILEVTEGITYDRPTHEPQRTFHEPDINEEDPGAALLAVLRHPNVASKRRAFKHYDTEVQGNTVLRPGEADAGVIKPLEESEKAVAISSDCNPLYGRVSPYHGATNAVWECMRNLAAVGARPRGFTNCLNFGNPEKPDVLWQFEQAVRGLSDACSRIGQENNEPVPIVSGNVSFYNESTTGSAVDPSPHVTGVGIIDDYRKAVTLHLKRPGSVLCMIGERKDEMGGSIYYQTKGELGKNIPEVDFESARGQLNAILELIDTGKVLSCHDISDGGLAACVAEMCIGPDGDGAIGAQIEFDSSLPLEKTMFSETGGFVCEISGESFDECAASCKKHGVALQRIGMTTDQPVLTFNDTVNLNMKDIADAWLHGFEEAIE